MSARLRIACMLALVFLAGAMSNHAVQRVRSVSAAPESPPSWAELARAMNLTAQQQERIDSIFTAYQPRSDALLRDLAPRMQALADSMHADLLPMLTSQQQQILSRAQHRQLFLLRRKSADGERVDTIRVQPGGSR